MIDVLGLLGEGSLDLHTSIVLTYSIDFVLYDGLIRRRFRQAGVVNQMVFCDFHRYQEQLATLGTARRFGRSYSVTPVYQDAAFHPKLYLVLGRKGGRLLIGSGNATIGGLLRNAETFGLFEYERGRDSGPHPAFRQCVEFVERLSQNGAEVINKQLARARGWSPWLDSDPAPDHRTVLFGGPGRPPLLDQINTALRDKPVQSAVVCTASVDRQLAALLELSGLTTRGRVRCIIQPDQIELDGQAVRRLGKAVEWKAFVDPYPRTKKKRRDVYSHAKLMVFDCGDREVLVYGSANASKPALLDAGGNSETVVLFDPWKRGTAVKRLGLDASLETQDIANELVDRTWDQPDEDHLESYLVVLTAAVPAPSGISMHIARGKVPDGAILELYEGLGRPATLQAKVSSASEGLFARLRGIPETVRLARLVAAAGEPLSNVVGLTWPEVASVQSSSGIHARTEAALVAMQDGTLVGTVLFELLDQVRDFEVVHGGGPTRKAPSELEETASEKDRSTESFYTDSVPGDAVPISWSGDRSDLDLLAALVQPLQTERRDAKRDGAEDDDEADDSVLDEEAERRNIDSKKGRATGEEGKESPSRTSNEALQRASKRLCRRLDRAATAVETALERRRELASVPPTGLARQVWMAQIAAFLAGRMAPTSDGDDVLCLEPIDFAGYTLRVCRALSGGKDGGLLGLVPAEAFAGPDGDSLKRGMSFLWTCLIFAVAEVATYWKMSPVVDVQDEEEENEYAEDVWDAVPELIAARFVLAIRPFCRKPDSENIVRRLPAWANNQEGWFDEWRRRIDRLANTVARIESQAPGRSKERNPPAPGDLVYHPIMGVTVLMRHRDGGTCYLLDLSKADQEHPENVRRVFPVDQVHRVPVDVERDGWVWREPYWQVPGN